MSRLPLHCACVFCGHVLCPLQKPLLDKVPSLKVVMEHITTADAAEFVAAAPDNVAASVTPQHMLLNRNALFAVSQQKTAAKQAEEQRVVVLATRLIGPAGASHACAKLRCCSLTAMGCLSMLSLLAAASGVQKGLQILLSGSPWGLWA